MGPTSRNVGAHPAIILARFAPMALTWGAIMDAALRAYINANISAVITSAAHAALFFTLMSLTSKIAAGTSAPSAAYMMGLSTYGVSIPHAYFAPERAALSRQRSRVSSPPNHGREIISAIAASEASAAVQTMCFFSNFTKGFSSAGRRP